MGNLHVVWVRLDGCTVPSQQDALQHYTKNLESLEFMMLEPLNNVYSPCISELRR